MPIRVLSASITKCFSPVRINALKLFINCRSYSERAYFHQVGSEPLLYRNLGQQVQRAATLYGDRVAVLSCDENQQLTFKQLQVLASTLAIQLQSLGLERGDHVGLWAPNNLQWYVSLMAAALAGFPVVCINPAFQPQEITYALNKAKVKALITMDECGKQNFHAILKQVLPNTTSAEQTISEETFPSLRHVIMQSDRSLKEFINFNQLLNGTVTVQQFVELNNKVPQISPESTCLVQFTSGTTGLSKAALISHFSYVNQGHQLGIFFKLPEGPKRFCVTVPFFHAFGLAVIMSALNYGGTLVLPHLTFNSVKALDTIEREKCHIILGTPTMFVDMLEQQRKMKRSTDSLELGLVGGATCSPEVLMQSKSVFGLRDMIIAYGMSESTSASFTQDGSEPMESAVNTVGRLFDHCEAKVIDDKGETVAFGEPGELCVKGFLVMREYMDDEEKTKEVLDGERWLKTGDQFILQSNGLGRIVGRKKDIIIRGGENIFPKEIEDFLDTHEDILESQVIGVPDERMGEEICACLRLRADAKKLTAEDIRNYCKGKIAHFKIPRYVCQVEEFPKTTSGKIQKFKLREMMKF